MSEEPSFVDQLLRGTATVYEYDDYVDKWHDLPDSADVPPLHEYLGLSWEEYQVVARDALAFRFVAAARKQNISLIDLMNSQAEYGLAARSQDTESTHRVLELLKSAGKLD